MINYDFDCKVKAKMSKKVCKLQQWCVNFANMVCGCGREQEVQEILLGELCTE